MFQGSVTSYGYQTKVAISSAMSISGMLAGWFGGV